MIPTVIGKDSLGEESNSTTLVWPREAAIL